MTLQNSLNFPILFTLRMKCGTAIGSYGDWRGEVTNWVSGGTIYDILAQLPSTPLAANTLDPYIYRHERSGSSAITYNIPVQKGFYTVRLHFCENYENNVGARVMASIKINDVTRLTNFDILAQVPKFTALVREFTNIDCSTTGFCKIALSNGLINGIELIRIK